MMGRGGALHYFGTCLFVIKTLGTFLDRAEMNVFSEENNVPVKNIRTRIVNDRVARQRKQKIAAKRNMARVGLRS